MTARIAAPIRICLVLAVTLVLAPTSGRAAGTPPCPPTDAATSDTASLPQLAAALHPGNNLAILVIGSAPWTAADQAAPPAPPSARNAKAAPPAAPPFFPWQMAHVLESSVHGAKITVTARGARGLAATDLLDVLRAELGNTRRYNLVLWQTGTIDAARGVSPDAFYQTLADGAALASSAGADLVLIEPQYSRFLAAHANVQPYLDAMQAAGALPGVSVFHRYDIMRDWVELGAIDLENTARADRTTAAQRLHACLGRALAHDLLIDTQSARANRAAPP